VSSKKTIPVLVTTSHRGVFFGRVTEAQIKQQNKTKTLDLIGARNCIYWPSSNQGFLGLASMGPVSGTKIGPAADITVHDVTCIARCTAEATKAWEAAKWNS